MPGFAEEFEEGQTLIKMYKMKQNIHRALELQARSKIKPSSMNPNLLTMSKLRGGAEPVPLDLYWPSATQNQHYK